MQKHTRSSVPAALALLAIVFCSNAAYVSAARTVLKDDKPIAYGPGIADSGIAEEPQPAVRQQEDGPPAGLGPRFEDFGLLPQQQFGSRIEGSGQLGSRLQALLAALNDLADRVPRVGAESVSQTAAAGEQTAQVRNAVTFLNTLPLLTAAFNEAGAAMNGTGAGATVIDQLDTAVAKDVAADRGNEDVTLGAASSIQGVSVTDGPDSATGSELRGKSNAVAGEKGLDVTTEGEGDGATSSTTVNQRGIGDAVSTRIRSSNLAAAASDSRDGGPTNFGGSVQIAAADTLDRDDLSTTRDLGRAENTAITMTGSGGANRYGYTWSPTNTINVNARGTEAARAQSRAGHLGTGYYFGGNTVKSTTYISREPTNTPPNSDKA